MKPTSAPSQKTSSTKPSVRLTFHGAAQTVTGSRFLVEVEDRKIMVDCGLFQGKKNLRLRNWAEPTFNPSALSAIVLTHAHIDHTGYLPLVVRYGFQGPIYCTPATKELLHLLLPDSAHLQEEEARYANKHGTSKHRPAKPLYTEADVKRTLKLLRTFQRNQEIELFPKIRLNAHCAGHILGSTSLNMDVFGKRITFSGDIGRYDSPILPDPEPVSFGDLLLCEATYGNRLHSEDDILSELAAVINRVVIRSGPLLIPAFAVGRTQNLLYYIAKLERDGKIPILPVYVDSPMAVDATEIYQNYRHDYDEEAASLLKQGESPLATERLTFCRTRDESKRLNNLSGARIIISASGMVNGGRIMHHMQHGLGREETTVLFVGYQAEGTRGRLIESGARTIKIFGQEIEIKAHIESVSGLSAHGDRDELLRWLKSGKGYPRKVKIIHGEKEPSQSFSYAVKKHLGFNASPAEYLETIEV